MDKKKWALLILSLTALSACGGGTTSTATSIGSQTGTTSQSESTSLKRFEGLIFASQNVTYDGEKHSLTVQNAPSGATIEYDQKDLVAAGIYPIIATVSEAGYVTERLSANLTILEGELTPSKIAELGLKFEDATYPYDGESHTLQLVGDVPNGTTVSYTIDGAEGNSSSITGEHMVVCTLKVPNYKSYQLTAKLAIVAVEKSLYSTVVGSTILFQNDLDNDTLYGYNTSLKKASYDVLAGFSGTGTLSFGLVKSLYGNAVVSYQENTDGTLKKTKVLAGVNADTLAAVDSTHFYYSVHNLLVNKADNGIYYYDTAKQDDDYRGEKVIADDYATAMVVSSGVLYYLNQDKAIVSYVSGTKTTYLNDDKIYELTAKDGYLYYNKGSTAVKGLYRMALATKKEEKLTLDNGRDLVIVGNALYYINKDVLTTSLYGKGIYRVPLDGSLLNANGTRIVDGDQDKIGSLSSDGTSLFYYRFNNAHFYKNTVSGGNETDLMADFVKPEDTTLVGAAANGLYEGEVYYANLKDDGCLYKYNLNSKTNVKVLPYSVNNIAFDSGYLYFGSYFLTNYAEWRMDLTSKVIAKISSDRLESLRFAGGKIYCLNVSETKAKLQVMDLDGSNAEILSDKGFDPFSLDARGGKAYLVRDPALGYKTLDIIDVATKTETTTSNKCISFVAADDLLYLYDQADQYLESFSFASSKVAVLATKLPKLTDFAYQNSHLYAQNSETSSLVRFDNTGFTTLANVAASSIVGAEGVIYFTSAKTQYLNNYPSTAYTKGVSDGTLYSYNDSLQALVMP